MNHQALLALVDEAARDPSGARRLLELADAMVSAELAKKQPGMPSGYIYAGGIHLVATLAELEPEPLPTDPPNMPLTKTANPPFRLRVPFDCLIQGVSGTSYPEVVPMTLDKQLGQLLSNQSPAGRDLFSVGWDLNGDENFVQEDRGPSLEPAVTVLGTRKNPRPLGWLLKRDDYIRVYARNLTNLIIPGPLDEGRDDGWTIHVSVEFHGLNLEAPK